MTRRGVKKANRGKTVLRRFSNQ